MLPTHGFDFVQVCENHNQFWVTAFTVWFNEKNWFLQLNFTGITREIDCDSQWIWSSAFLKLNQNSKTAINILIVTGLTHTCAQWYWYIYNAINININAYHVTLLLLEAFQVMELNVTSQRSTSCTYDRNILLCNIRKSRMDFIHLLSVSRVAPNVDICKEKFINIRITIWCS